MKRNIALAGLATIFATCLPGMAAPARAVSFPCSLAVTAGNWAFTDNGTVVGVGPRTAVGVATLDPHGNVLNGVATSNLNGSVEDETFSGTYSVNSNCTGAMTINIYDQSTGNLVFTVSLSLSFDQKMEHLRGVFTSVAEPDGTPLQTIIAFDADKR
jgi:hypothetical protein